VEIGCGSSSIDKYIDQGESGYGPFCCKHHESTSLHRGHLRHHYHHRHQVSQRIVHSDACPDGKSLHVAPVGSVCVCSHPDSLRSQDTNRRGPHQKRHHPPACAPLPTLQPNKQTSIGPRTHRFAPQEREQKIEMIEKLSQISLLVTLGRCCCIFLFLFA
jgi:hypothetical protein